jgi:hypothetical protein
MPHSKDSSADSDVLDLDTAPSSRTTALPDAFPRPAGTTITTVSNIRYDKEPLLSPALTGFSFNIDPEPTYPYPDFDTSPEVASLSFADPFPAFKPTHAVSRTPTGTIANPSMGDFLTRSNSASRRHQYYEDAFSDGKTTTKEGARKRIQRDSPIVAELRTNVIIKDEYTIVTSLSQHLSERYRRPESAILLTVTHSSCLMMGGSFEPAYILNITAIPSEVQPVTNKRNAYLIQCFVAEVLHVPSNRGIVRFLGLEEERIATNGSTVAGDIERAEKEVGTSNVKEEKSQGLVRSLTSKSSRRSIVGGNGGSDKRKSIIKPDKKETNGDMNGHTIERKFSTRSLRSVRSLKGKISQPIPTEMPPELLPSPTSISGFSFTSKPTPALPKIHRLSPLHGIGNPAPNSKDLPPPPPSPLSQSPPSIPLPPFTSSTKGSEKGPQVTSASRRPSMSASTRPQSARKNLSNITGPAEVIPSPPPIPFDSPPMSSKLSKRKSFVSLFSRKNGVGSRSETILAADHLGY